MNYQQITKLVHGEAIPVKVFDKGINSKQQLDLDNDPSLLFRGIWVKNKRKWKKDESMYYVRTVDRNRRDY